MLAMAQNHLVRSECLDCTANLSLEFEMPVMHDMPFWTVNAAYFLRLNCMLWCRLLA